MTFTIPIRHILSMRHEHSDRLLMDYLELVTIAREPGQVHTADLQQRWHCSQPTVSRRINALVACGLIDATSSHGAYLVHHMQLPEVQP